MEDIFPGLYRIAIRYKSVFSPINLTYLLDAFGSEGYAKLVPYPFFRPIDDHNVIFSGSILQKGELIIDVDTKINSAGLKTRDGHKLIENMDVFNNKVFPMVDNKNAIWFYEFQAKMEFKLYKNLMKSLQLEGNIVENLKKFGKNMADDLNVSSIALWGNGNPDSDNFTEIRVDPSVLKNKMAVYKIIYRNSNWQTFSKNVKDVINNKSQLIDFLK